MFEYLRFRIQRSFRRLGRDIKLWRRWLTGYLERHVWGKWRQLGIIRRLVLVWWGIMLLTAAGTYLQTRDLRLQAQIDVPVSGGHYMEGVVGSVKNINPILPESSAAADVTRLVFSSLFRYTPKGQLEGDLANSWTVSDDGQLYTFKLKQHVKWHDGTPFTARDVLFTVIAIQNPDSRSPLAPAWHGVTVEAPDNNTVIMKLPAPYAAFMHQLTVGILPSHLLETTEPARLRVAAFNQRPIGTGPFRLKTTASSGQEIQLEAYQDYHWGRPRLDRFSLRFYASNDEMIDAYAKRQITALARLRPDQALDERRLPELRRYNLVTSSLTAAFFRIGNGPLGDVSVRQALAGATDRQQLVQEVFSGYARPLKLPLLPGQLGYTSRFQPPGYNVSTAEAKLEAAGWKRGGDGLRRKNNQVLKLRLVTADSRDLAAAAEIIKQQWQRLGVEIELTVTDPTNLQQSYIRPRRYDVLLYGISIGGDPDVYPYWHSSQAADPGLNLSGWSNANADKALENARITSHVETRVVKYGSFLANWASDVPAVVLYRNSYVYGAHQSAQGITADRLVEPADRFYGVEKWTVNTRPAWRFW